MTHGIQSRTNDEIVRARLYELIGAAQDADGANDVPVSMWSVKVRGTMRDDTILQHPAAVAQHPADRQVPRHVLPRNDLVQTVFNEEVRPIFKTITVDAVGVTRQ